ncbi:MAG TPA: hypothetical protein VFE47_31050 [Tepidisphaeraceae bacterium]|jgi:hypothetical protein|nr:hypothetical protein [Tepidisphaeraceae bacterium]
MRDWPWEMWVYMAIGAVVTYFYWRRERLSMDGHSGRTAGAVYFFIAMLWPVILFAMLVNPPDKSQKK